MQGFRLGSIFGFEIRVDLSWFIIFFLILWTFIGSVFPANYPKLSQETYIVMGIVTTLLFFASLLAHELLGIITLNRVKEIPREEWNLRTVKETMIPVEKDVLVAPEETMPQVLQKMEASGARRALVARNGILEGIITANDVASWLRRRRDLGEPVG
jgi:hypothetical protein